MFFVSFTERIFIETRPLWRVCNHAAHRRVCYCVAHCENFVDNRKASIFVSYYMLLNNLLILLAVRIVFSLDVMAAIVVSQNNETADMFVSQTSPVGVELFSYVNAFFLVPINLHRCWSRLGRGLKRVNLLSVRQRKFVGK